ncbi:MAG: hypothetical protein Athens071426_406 [Parcubacteria group bacterium Athens0714_26]|nr:MAG: hypothetical protein Athens071426_406 [Parcubacteria group bacterium Athens0714_26]
MKNNEKEYKPDPPQFGYIYLRRTPITIDPIGKLIKIIESLIHYFRYRNNEVRFYGQNAYHLFFKWDKFYRCKLGVQNKIFHWQMKKYE